MEEAIDEIQEFEEAFPIEHVDEETSNQQAAKQRVYWRDIIEREEQKAAQETNAPEEVKAPLTEAEAARLKGEAKDDDEDEGAVKQIGSVNPIDDFQKMVNDRKKDRVGEALQQMKAIIERYIRCSLKGDLYEKALDCLKELRQACVSEDEAAIFNQFMARVKEHYGKGSHSAFFSLLVKNKISLITCHESELSSVVTPKEAEEFLTI